MVAKVANHCNHLDNRSISVNASVKACINCIWYEQYYRKNRGNVVSQVPVDTGFCLLKERRYGALKRACKEFETEKEERACTK